MSGSSAETIDSLPHVRQQFHFVMIKPSHYDDDGYVMRHFRGVLISHTLRRRWRA